MSVEADVRRPSPLRQRIHGFGLRHPQWWVAALAAGGWAVLLATGIAGHRHGDPSGGAAGAAWSGGAAWSAGVAWSAVMVTAMMAPLVLPNVRRLAYASLRRRRFRAGAAFLVGYLGVWTAVAVITDRLVAAGTGLLGRLATTMLTFGAAAAWQYSGRKRRALRRCALTIPTALRGWRADRDCARLGVLVALGCLGTCWAIMTAAAATGHDVAAMAVLSAVAAHERTARRYEPATGAAVIALLGAVLLIGG